MTQTLKIQFSHQSYQKDAVDAVVGVFDGQPLANHEFTLVQQHSSVRRASDGSVGNMLHLSTEQLLENVQKVQAKNFADAKGAPDVSKQSKELLGDNDAPHFSLEMETGTGKTYVFIKTMYELNKTYGFKKFVVVVPSVAIREGTMKNLEITREHFAADYEGVPFVPVLYDSKHLNRLRDFSQSDALSVLVINIDSFTKDNNKINQKGEMFFAPIEYIRAVNPIVIIDEPQNFETDIRRQAIQSLNPMCSLRYSATHRNAYNLLYALNPVQAYDLGLVKQIEVDGVTASADHNQAFVKLLGIEQKAKSMIATVLMDVNEKSGVKPKAVRLKVGEDLYEKSKRRDVYQDGYVLNDFFDDESVGFSGRRVLRVNEAQGEPADDVMRFQIERTVIAHFAKMKRFKDAGLQIKVLSLFFIDKVANYRMYDADGNASRGKFAVWFEEAFAKCASMSAYKGLVPHALADVHNGYFSGDKKGKGAKVKTVWVDSTERGSAKDDSTYELIMRDKERLLSMSEPLQFIFSHSALREGWDNPNVFQICTLNESHSAMKKRQEIGRGLRLCVNQNGERVMDKKVNVLTVIPNESYEAFAKSLQQEIEDETGVKFEGRVNNARDKARVACKPLTKEEDALFRDIWNKIDYQTRYSVKLETPELIDACVKLLRDKNQYPSIQRPKVKSEKGLLHIDRHGVQGVKMAADESEIRSFNPFVPDVYAYLQDKLHLSRETLFAILDGSGRLDELLLNPQAFLDTAIGAIKTVLNKLLVSGIEYHELVGQHYEMSLLQEVSETYLSGLFPRGAKSELLLDKTLLQAQALSDMGEETGEPFECVVTDSNPETQFAYDCQIKPEVKFFFKLPKRFKIDTPLGTYNPDWAVVFENDKKVYFVVETKSTLVEAERRASENLRIKCGERHFALRKDVTFKVATALGEVI
jgi:type III restriction enzyme